MGTWSIEPSGKTASITQEGVVNVDPNTGASINYTVYYKDSGYCGKYEFTQEGTTPGPDECDPCRKCMGPIRENFYIKNESGRSVDIYASVKIKMWKTIPGQEYPKYIGVYDYIENGDPIPTLTLDDQRTSREIKAENLHFGSESTVSLVPCPLPCEWECIGEETDYMNGQTIVEASVYNSDNSGGLTCSISPTTFSTGTTYTVTILQQ